MRAVLTLERDQVDLWRAALDVSPRAAAALTRSLSSDERARAERFHRELDRQRFVVAHGALRGLLSAYLGIDATDVQLVDDEKGKPRLAPPASGWLQFNISHSADVAVFGFVRDRAIGVDVERVRKDFPFADVARRSFSAAERATVESLPDERRVDAFFAAWTRKEAYLKGLGVGIAGQSAVPAQLDDWSVVDVDAGVGYAAAVAVEGRDVQVPTVATQVSGLGE